MLSAGTDWFGVDWVCDALSRTRVKRVRGTQMLESVGGFLLAKRQISNAPCIKSSRDAKETSRASALLYYAVVSTTVLRSVGTTIHFQDIPAVYGFNDRSSMCRNDALNESSLHEID